MYLTHIFPFKTNILLTHTYIHTYIQKLATLIIGSSRKEKSIMSHEGVKEEKKTTGKGERTDR